MTETSEKTYQAVFTAGERALQIGSSAEAEALFEEAVVLAHDDHEAAEALCKLARARVSYGHFKPAEEAMQAAFERAAHLPDVLARAKLHMGVVRWLQGDMASARTFLEQSSAELKRLGLVRDRSVTLGNLGVVYLLTGEYHLAIVTCKQAIEVQESLQDMTRLTLNLGNLGECYLDLGATAEARALFERALVLAGELQAEALSMDSQRNLAMVHAEEGDFDGAIALLEHSRQLAAQYQRNDNHTQVLFSLAEVYLQRGDLIHAEALARDLLRDFGDVPTYRAKARLILGLCALRQGDSLSALTTLENGLLDAQAGQSTIMVLRFHAALGQVVAHPAIAEVHRRIAGEFVAQIGDALEDKVLHQAFRGSRLVRSVLG